VPVDFAACERSGVAKQVRQATFDCPSMLRYDEEIVDVSSQIRRECRRDTQQRIGIPGTGDNANGRVACPIRSGLVHREALKVSHDSGVLRTASRIKPRI
jgi:hypothetical protein